MDAQSNLMHIAPLLECIVASGDNLASSCTCKAMRHATMNVSVERGYRLIDCA